MDEDKKQKKSILDRLKHLTFYKKRPFYVVLTIIFSVIIVADVALAAFMPANMNFSSGTQNQEMQQSPTLENSEDEDSEDSGSTDEAGSSDSTGEAESSGSTDEDEGTSTDSQTSTENEDGEAAGGMPAAGDFDSSEMPDMSDSDGEMPDMSDSDGEMPDFEDGEMPENSGSTDENTDETFAVAADGSNENGDQTQSGSTGSSSGRMGWMQFLQAVRSHWLVILIVAGILDALSIFMLVRLTIQKRKAQEEAFRAQVAADGEVHLQRPKVKKTSPWVWAIPVVGVVLLLVVVRILTSQTGTDSSQTEASVYSETATVGDISTVLPGTGTLTEEDAEAVSLPSDVEILEWYVSNGDTVAVGDKLAKVDTVSVMTAIATVQESLDALDEELSSYEEEDTEETLTAAADGRVKVIYAQEDTDVVDTMYEDGSLMLISLDGLMAVSFETDEDVSVGDSVTVTLSDGTEEEGTVESSINGTVVVTLTDDGPEYGDSVTVTDADGDELGTGELYIHSELSVMTYSGIVSEISVSEEEEVESGDTLLTLDEVDTSAEFELLVEQRSELEEQMQTLVTLYEDEYVYAEVAGVISGLSDSTSSSEDTDSSTESDSSESSDTSDEDSDSTSSDTSDESTTSDSSSSDSSTSDSSDTISSANASVVSTSASMTTSIASITPLTSTSSSGSVSTVSSVSSTETEETTAEAESDASTSETTSEDSTTADSISSESEETESETTAATDSSSEETSAETEESSDEEENSDPAQQDETYVNYIGVVTAVNDDGTITLSLLAEESEIEDYSDLSSLEISTDDMTEETEITLDASLLIYSYADEEWSSVEADSLEEDEEIAEGDILVLLFTSETSEDGEETLTLSGLVRTTDEMLGTTKTDEESSSEKDEDEEDDDKGGSGAGGSGDGGANTETGSGGIGSGQETSGSSTSSLEDLINSLTGSSSGTDSSSFDTSTFDTSSLTGSTDIASADGTTDAAQTAAEEALEEEISETYSVEETTWCYITPQDTMSITITVDELDILSLEVGQEATVTLDAFPGQSFVGVVESIDTSGTNSGGSSKYTAVITIEREEDMLAGMNASVKITLETEEDVLYILEDALVEDETGVYVYTSYDEETDTLGDPVEVTTGVSDGEYVEILSGLSEGDEYWYETLDTVNYSTTYSTGTSGGFLFGNRGGGEE